MLITVYLTILSFAFIPLSQSSTLSDLLNLTPATVGLALSSSVNMLGMIQWGVRQSSELETNLTSVERILEYAKLEPEKNVIMV
jgi:ATP-binding cassette subfamily C (CFTR/MRP) protein 4